MSCSCESEQDRFRLVVDVRIKGPTGYARRLSVGLIVDAHGVHVALPDGGGWCWAGWSRVLRQVIPEFGTPATYPHCTIGEQLVDTLLRREQEVVA